MPSHSCFVPGCRSGNPVSLKRARKEGKGCPSLFRPPKEMIEKWNSVIKRNDRNLCKDDVICSLHFKEEDIERHYSHVIDGQIVLIDRGIPKLRNGAVPSIFSNSNMEEIKPQKRGRKPGRRNNSGARTSSVGKKSKTNALNCNVKTFDSVSKKHTKMALHQTMKRSIKAEHNFSIYEKNKYASTDGQLNTLPVQSPQLRREVDYAEPEDFELQEYLVEDCDKFLNETCNQSIDISETLLQRSETDLSTENTKPEPYNTNETTAGLQHCHIAAFTYSTLIDHASTVILPSSLWAMHRHPRDKYVAFIETTFSSDGGLSIEKGVVFKGTCKPDIFFYGHNVPLPDIGKQVTCLNDVNKLIENINAFQAVCLLEQNRE
ncbi:uncharacterized protein [Periplaneta americana]|uniref:uncharacterized protein n=1 Tax=Periplaneta americana TaxID=6978 RepID=UPI0037E79F15